MLWAVRYMCVASVRSQFCDICTQTTVEKSAHLSRGLKYRVVEQVQSQFQARHSVIELSVPIGMELQCFGLHHTCTQGWVMYFIAFS